MNYTTCLTNLFSLLAVLKIIQPHKNNVEVGHNSVEVWPQIIRLSVHVNRRGGKEGRGGMGEKNAYVGGDLEYIKNKGVGVNFGV